MLHDRHLAASNLNVLAMDNGQPGLGILPHAVQRERSRTIDPGGLRMAIPTLDKFGVAEPQQLALQRQLTPHPLNSYAELLRLQRLADTLAGG